MAVTGSVIQGKSIFICEDDINMLESIADLLTELGAVVEKFEDAPEALARIKVQRPHIVLSDVSMPTLGGIEFLEAIRKEGINIPLIFLTGNADIGTYRRGLAHGQFDFLTKPLVPDALVKAVEKALVFGKTDAESPFIAKLSSALNPVQGRKPVEE